VSNYGSQNAWQRLGTGWYVSPCGAFEARGADGRWVLLRRQAGSLPFEVGRYTTLADCQARAKRGHVGLPLQVERERMFRLALRHAGYCDRSMELAVARNRHLIEEEGVRP
jgi:hypothetical protein